MFLISVKRSDFLDLKNSLMENKFQKTLTGTKYLEKTEKEMFPLLKQLKILSIEYDIVVTNPPYMGNSGMNKKLSNYLKSCFSNTKKDFFSAFIEKSFDFCKPEGHVGLLTPYVWMFIQSFLKLRENIVQNKTITTLTQLEYNAFPEACVPVCIFTFKNSKHENNGQYIKLSDFKGTVQNYGDGFIFFE